MSKAQSVSVECWNEGVTYCFDAVLYHAAFGAIMDVPLKRDIQRAKRLQVRTEDWLYDVVRVSVVNRSTLRLRLALLEPV